MEPVITARDLLATESRYAWPAPLVGSLRDRSYDLALDWVFRCTRFLLTHGETASLPLLDELKLIEEWRKSPPPIEVFEAKTDELWYRRRNEAHTAMARLCWNVACVVCPGQERGPNWLWPVVSLLCDFDRPQRELVEWCIADFEAFVAEHPYQSLSNARKSSSGNE